LTKSMGNDMAYAESAVYGGGYPTRGYAEQDFAPEVEERKIIKTTSMSSEVDRGTFGAAVLNLKNIIDSSDSFILNENIKILLFRCI